MMEEKPIKSRHKQLTWKQLKTMETKQEMPVLGKHTNIQGVCWREDLLGSGAWHSPTQHFTWCFGSSLKRTVRWEINIFRFRWQYFHACHWHPHLARPPNPYSTCQILEAVTDGFCRTAVGGGAPMQCPPCWQCQSNNNSPWWCCCLPSSPGLRSGLKLWWFRSRFTSTLLPQGWVRQLIMVKCQHQLTNLLPQWICTS